MIQYLYILNFLFYIDKKALKEAAEKEAVAKAQAEKDAATKVRLIESFCLFSITSDTISKVTQSSNFLFFN